MPVTYEQDEEEEEMEELSAEEKKRLLKNVRNENPDVKQITTRNDG